MKSQDRCFNVESNHIDNLMNSKSIRNLFIPFFKLCYYIDYILNT
jgi:hypothetical protein